jgi:hypothetical protein
MIPPWWERYHGLLEEELEAFEQAGMPAEVDESARAAGLVRLSFTFATGGESIPLVATYPDLFPFVRPEVRAPYLDLDRHQNPFGRNLCLIGRSTANWSAGHQHLADLVRDQLPNLLAAARRPPGTPPPVPEDPQAEPFSDYFEYPAGPVIFIDNDVRAPAGVERGRMTVALEPSEGPGLRGFVAEIGPAKGPVSATLQGLGGLYEKPRRVSARWIRLPRPPRARDGAQMLELLANVARDLRSPLWARHGSWNKDVIGITFPEELQPGVVGDGWVFLIRARRGKVGHTYLCRVGRAGPNDLAERVPELRVLCDKTVLVIGLGGIGAPSALELIRAGIGELRVVDHDIVDPGTTVRWPLGFAFAGEPKVTAFERWAKANWPYTRVVPKWHRVGAVRDDVSQPSDLEVLDELLDGVDLVYDATAEVGIHYLISELAREKGIPYVEASTRNGAWGGIVARIIPGPGRPCWVCYAHALEDVEGSLAVMPGGLHQPLGCADPTFTGTGFDVTEFALAGVRLAVGTLVRGAVAGYPDPPWDAAVVNLRDATGTMITPTWSPLTIEVHRRCSRSSH